VSKPSLALDQFLSEAIVGLGFEYVGCEYFAQPRGATLQIYAEKRDANITIDDCALISRQLKPKLAVENLIAADFSLEVSSPGIERRLFRAEHYIRFIGHTIKMRLYHPHNGQRNFVGKIVDADNEKLTLDVNGQSHEFAMLDIDKGRLVAEIDI